MTGSRRRRPRLHRPQLPARARLRPLPLPRRRRPAGDLHRPPARGVAHPAARLGSLIARPPTILVGLRSYSFYLWHWPAGADPAGDRRLPSQGDPDPAASGGGLGPRRPLLPLRSRQGEAAGAARYGCGSAPVVAVLGADPRPGGLGRDRGERRPAPPAGCRRGVDRGIRQGDRDRSGRGGSRDAGGGRPGRRGSSPSATR